MLEGVYYSIAWSTPYIMGWLRLVGSSKLWVSFAKEPYKRDNILQKRPIIVRSILIVATPYSKASSEWGRESITCQHITTTESILCVWVGILSHDYAVDSLKASVQRDRNSDMGWVRLVKS